MLRNMLIDEQELYKVYVLISSHKAKSKIEPLRFKQTHQDMEMEILETRSNDGRELRFFVLGCQGNGLESQRRVAALMNEYIKNHPDKRPDFILLAGDNIYECGPDSPTDPGFKNCFENIYLQFPYLKDIPFFPILGNHDENLHKASLPGSQKGVERGLYEIAYSYLNAKSGLYTTPLDKTAVPETTNIANLPPDTYMLDQNDLPPWNMPARAYSLVKGNTQLLCIDSNTYVKEYLDYLDYLDYVECLKHLETNSPIDPNNHAYKLVKKFGQYDAKTLAAKLTDSYARLPGVKGG